ncbi:hypothetical protein V6N11_046109 [Hibiscus sabdariffa]|uniref:Nucleoprotein TPR/MPL1 domain-containing protein n=2 Tax=Hibiscus sabdariffa TaxID=183260 RepID=A0ABR2G2R7_9ROSI
MLLEPERFSIQLRLNSSLLLLLEKELIERHNTWLNEELTAKVDNLIEIRRTHAELEADMSAKLADVEKQYNECSSSLNWHKERTKELETKLTSVQEELCSSKEVATSNEERFSAELSIKGSRELGKLKLSREHQLLAIHLDDSRRRWCLVILSIA